MKAYCFLYSKNCVFDYSTGICAFLMVPMYATCPVNHIVVTFSEEWKFASSSMCISAQHPASSSPLGIDVLLLSSVNLCLSLDVRQRQRERDQVVYFLSFETVNRLKFLNGT